MPINRRKADGLSGSNEKEESFAQKDSGKKNRPKLLHAILSFLFFPVLFHTYTATINALVLSTNISSSSSSSHQCSYNELLQIRSQLVPELCVNNYERKTYWVQQCSLTLATKCPLPTWLAEY